MTTTAATSMTSKNNTTASSLVGGGHPRRAALARVRPVRRDQGSGDLDVDLVDARARRSDAGVAVARRGQCAQRPRAGGGEEPEVTGGRGDDLGGELVGRVEQADERPADRLTGAVHDAAGDHRFLL